MRGGRPLEEPKTRFRVVVAKVLLGSGGLVDERPSVEVLAGLVEEMANEKLAGGQLRELVFCLLRSRFLGLDF